MLNDGQGGISQPGFEAFTEPAYSPGYDSSTVHAHVCLY